GGPGGFAGPAEIENRLTIQGRSRRVSHWFRSISFFSSRTMRSFHGRHRVDRRATKPGEGDQPRERVAENADFFPFVERSRTVVYGQFDRAIAFADQFDEEFKIEVETV